VAEAIGISPLEIRRRNCYRPGGVTPTGQILRESVAIEEVMERAAEAAEFERVRERTAREREERGEGERTARGIGLALAWHGAGFTGSGEEKMGSVASLELTAEGVIRVLIANTEMGQGTKTIFPQLVADELGVGMNEVEMAPQDTSIVPDSGPTVASRTAMVVGGLIVDAARKLKAHVEDAPACPSG
jgi:CO/xanthine dehydrogenase Mo-binding subunit